jgi:hypothetical protein
MKVAIRVDTALFANSRLPPVGRPRASRLTRTAPRSRSARYSAVPSPSTVGFSPRTTSTTPTGSTPSGQCRSGWATRSISTPMVRSPGPTFSSGLSRPIRM